MRVVLSLLFIALVLLDSSRSAFACVCELEPGKRSEKQIKAAIAREFNESASVFSGEVVALDTFTVKFKLITMWKGDALEEFTMSTGARKISEDSYRSSTCDYRFKVGETYLVYARVADDNQLVARSCTRTNVLFSGQIDTPELDILNPAAYHAPSPLPVSRVERFLSWRNLTALAADGAMACLSNSLFLPGLKADPAPQLRRSVRVLSLGVLVIL